MAKKAIKIFPSLLAENKAGFKKEFLKVRKYFHYFQVDVMDGIFVKNKSDISPGFIENIMQGENIEVHLMVNDVAGYIMKWQNLTNVKKIIWHFEAEKNNEAIICLAKYLKKNKIKPGLAINPATKISQIKNVLAYFDTIQIMSIHPGAQGKTFRPESLNKIKALRKKYPHINISIDGAVSDKNIQAIKKAGANIITVGSYLQNAKNVKETLKKLAQQ